jgi:hypothetical protein
MDYMIAAVSSWSEPAPFAAQHVDRRTPDIEVKQAYDDSRQSAWSASS